MTVTDSGFQSAQESIELARCYCRLIQIELEYFTRGNRRDLQSAEIQNVQKLLQKKRTVEKFFAMEIGRDLDLIWVNLRDRYLQVEPQLRSAGWTRGVPFERIQQFSEYFPVFAEANTIRSDPDNADPRATIQEIGKELAYRCKEEYQSYKLAVDALDRANIRQDIQSSHIASQSTAPVSSVRSEYLGLYIDKENQRIGRVGFENVAKPCIGENERHVLQIVLTCGARGATTSDLKNGYPGDLDGKSLTATKKRIREKLAVFDLTLSKGSITRLNELQKKSIGPVP